MSKKLEYTLTLNSDQAHEALKAIELLMRLKINQPDQLSRDLLEPMYERIGCDEFCKRRDAANEYLRLAFAVIFPALDDWKKDTEWYRLYNLYQALRYAIHEAEHPNSVGVDSCPPMQFAEEPIPKCGWTSD